jgi:hypothetical protein
MRQTPEKSGRTGAAAPTPNAASAPTAHMTPRLILLARPASLETKP